jgi:signal transduction histidine kinase/ActR/RegA family two-component response regulator
MSAPESNPLSETVLVLAVSEPDVTLIQTVLNQAELTGRFCTDIEDLRRHIEAGAGAALLTDEVLTPEAMRCLVDLLHGQPSWSDLPLVILFPNVGPSATVNLRMLDLLGPLDNVTVLERPASSMTLASTLQCAVRARRRQYQVRDLLEQRARQVRRREHVLNSLAHELRNSLSTIRHATEILDQIGSPATPAVEQRATISRQTANLARLTDDLVEIYQILAGRLVLHRVPVDLRDLVGRCLAGVAAEVDAQHHTLVLTGESASLIVEGDPQRLEQVVIHLLTNAIRYTPPGGRIELNLARDQEEAVIRVRDSGVGIAPEVLPHLFHEFTETDVPEDRPDGRLRMGLTLVQHLVTLHGGKVSASSPGPNQGSEFVVRLPLPKAPVAGSPGSAEKQPISRDIRRILVIEDNPDTRMTLRLMLQLWGYQVAVAENGTEGVEMALSWFPQVALVDIGLPGKDGYQVARELRAALGERIFLVALTGYGRSHDRLRALESGFDRHLVKPVDPEILQELLVHPEAGAKMLA